MAGLLNAHEGDADLDEHGCGRGAKESHAPAESLAAPCTDFSPGCQLAAEPRSPAGGSRVSARYKVNRVGIGLLVPAAGHAGEAGYLGRRNDMHFRSGYRLRLAPLLACKQAMSNVEKEVGRGLSG